MPNPNKQLLEEAMKEFRQRADDCEIKIRRARWDNNREEAQYQEGLKAGYLNSSLDLARRLQMLK